MKIFKSLVFIILLVACGGSDISRYELKAINKHSIDKLDFGKILLVERHAIKSTHVYTYHEEDNKPGGGL
mgnify:CR=1 FL=1